MENRIRRQIMDAKYRLQLGAITANKLDAKAYYDENRNVTLNVAKIDYVTLGNEDYKVSDEEIKDRYNKEKERYALDTEVRLVDYILVTPTPSPEDASAASEEVAAAISNLKTTPAPRLSQATIRSRPRSRTAARLHFPPTCAMLSNASRLTAWLCSASTAQPTISPSY